jgi:hypothetical protein
LIGVALFQIGHTNHPLDSETDKGSTGLPPPGFP